MENSPPREDENNSDSAVKKFIEAKRAMHDDQCHDVDSNRKLRKELNLCRRKYYGTLKAMREGRKVGVSGRPSYLHETEKVAFWNWVREESWLNRCPSMMDMVEYVNRVVRMKRPVLMTKRPTVSKRYVRNLLKEGGLNLDTSRNMYVAQGTLTMERAMEFFRRVTLLIYKLHISKDMIFNMEEIHIPPKDPTLHNVLPSVITENPPVSYYNEDATMVGCISASGQSLPRAYVISPYMWSEFISRETFVPQSRIFRSENGTLTDSLMREWLLIVFLPWVQERRRLFGWKEALLIVDAHDNRFNNAILDLLNSNHVYVALVPPGATTVLLPLYCGLYSRYNQALKMYLKSGGIVETLRASEAAFSDTFTVMNILHAWERTTILSESHSSIVKELPKGVEQVPLIVNAVVEQALIPTNEVVEQASISSDTVVEQTSVSPNPPPTNHQPS